MSLHGQMVMSDINYTYGYYTELNPNRGAGDAIAGLAAPKVAAACELVLGKACSFEQFMRQQCGWWGNGF